MDKLYIVYRAFSPDGKNYIGRTMGDMISRRLRHEQSASRDSRLPFHAAIRKHQGAMRWETIAQVQTKSELYAAEQHFIKKYNALAPNGYNLRAGDRPSPKHNAEQLLRRLFAEPRTKDGFIKITPIFQAYNRLAGDAMRLGRTDEIVRLLSAELGQPPLEIIIGGNNSQNQGVWVHPYLAAYLSSTISPQTALAVSRICAESLQKI